MFLCISRKIVVFEIKTSPTRLLINQVQKCNLSSKQHHPVELNYRMHKGDSSKPPIVILHGMLSSLQNWTQLAKKIHQKTNRSVYIPDLRNHGSSPHSENMCYYHMSSDIENFMQKEEIDSAVVMGK